MNIQNFSGGAIWVHGNASHIVAKNLKFTHCGYGDATHLDKQSLPKDIPSYVTFAMLLDGGYKKPIQNIQIIDCVFAESGVHRDPARFAQAHSAICAYQGSDIDITGCTIDGAVALRYSAAVTLASLSNVTIKDVFITDVFAKGRAKGIFTSDVDGEVKDVQQASIVSNMPSSQFLHYLDNHASYKEDVEVDPEYRIAANHFKGIIPQHKENFDALLHEHKWREFRTLGRLVCHNSDKKSQTSAMYAKWVEAFCADVLDVKVKVISGFANFYPSGQTPLPAHRDQYKKWIIGLSFGDTRTLEFVPDDKNRSIVPFTMEAGDVFIFSPDVNNRYQHRMMPEQGGKRINLTYFLEILPGEDSAKLLKVPNNLQPSKIPALKWGSLIAH